MKPPLNEYTNIWIDERGDHVRLPGKVVVGNATVQPRPWTKPAVRFLYGTSWPSMIRVQDQDAKAEARRRK